MARNDVEADQFDYECLTLLAIPASEAAQRAVQAALERRPKC